MEEEEKVVEISLDSVACRVLLDSVDLKLSTWSGGEPEEQLLLFEMQDFLRRAVLELNF